MSLEAWEDGLFSESDLNGFSFRGNGISDLRPNMSIYTSRRRAIESPKPGFLTPRLRISDEMLQECTSRFDLEAKLAPLFQYDPIIIQSSDTRLYEVIFDRNQVELSKVEFTNLIPAQGIHGWDLVAVFSSILKAGGAIVPGKDPWSYELYMPPDADSILDTSNVAQELPTK